jgi:hypothetical protein
VQNGEALHGLGVDGQRPPQPVARLLAPRMGVAELAARPALPHSSVAGGVHRRAEGVVARSGDVIGCSVQLKIY